jgi:YD repeat-containing protein
MRKPCGGLASDGQRLFAPIRRLAALACLFWMSGSSIAATTGSGDAVVSPTIYYEQGGGLVRAGEAIEGLGPNLMGDKVNEYHGSLEFNYTDVSLPGNNALPVAVGRRLATGSREALFTRGHFGDWELEIPHLHTLIASGTTSTWVGLAPDGVTYTELRCSQFVSAPDVNGYTQGARTPVLGRVWWAGHHMSIPGAGDQDLLGRNAYVPNPLPTDGLTYPVLTKQHWQLSCLPKLANGTGEGFLAHAPDGTRYQFDHLAIRDTVPYHPLTGEPSVVLNRSDLWIMPSQVTDRFGNWVKYTYDPNDAWKLLSITASDGRSITLTYVTGTHRIQTVFDGTRTWTYLYDSNGALQTVRLPDSSAWQFSLRALEHTPFYPEDPGCTGDVFNMLDQKTYTGVITHPSGAKGEFSHKGTWHGTTNVPGAQEACGIGSVVLNGVTYINRASRYAGVYSLTSKTLSGPGMQAMTWSYAYSAPSGGFAPSTGQVVTKTVTVTDPLNHVTQNTYGTQYGLDEGLLLASAEGRATAGRCARSAMSMGNQRTGRIQHPSATTRRLASR